MFFDLWKTRGLNGSVRLVERKTCFKSLVCSLVWMATISSSTEYQNSCQNEIFLIFCFPLKVTGMMVVVQPGTPGQLVIATFVVIMYMSLTLKTAPYVSDVDDWISFVVSAALSCNTLAGFILIMDADRPIKSFAVYEIGIGLIVLNVCVVVMCAGNIVANAVQDCRDKKKGTRSSKKRSGMKKVTPLENGRPPAPTNSIRNWGNAVKRVHSMRRLGMFS